MYQLSIFFLNRHPPKRICPKTYPCTRYIRMLKQNGYLKHFSFHSHLSTRIKRGREKHKNFRLVLYTDANNLCPFSNQTVLTEFNIHSVSIHYL